MLNKLSEYLHAKLRQFYDYELQLQTSENDD